MMRLATILALAAPLFAHHSTRGAFDDRQIVVLSGTVIHVSWMNPHAGFTLLVTGADGKQATWTIELPSPNALGGQGWKRNDLKAGDQVSLGVWVAKTGATLASMRTITLPDGREMSGNSGWDNPVRLPQ